MRYVVKAIDDLVGKEVTKTFTSKKKCFKYLSEQCSDAEKMPHLYRDGITIMVWFEEEGLGDPKF